MKKKVIKTIDGKDIIVITSVNASDFGKLEVDKTEIIASASQKT